RPGTEKAGNSARTKSRSSCSWSPMAVTAPPCPARAASATPRTVRLARPGLRAYILGVRRNPDYGHKRARNKRFVPGGGTRRLHQDPGVAGARGRNRIDERLKGFALSRRGATVIGPQSTVANDNRAPAMALAA